MTTFVHPLLALLGLAFFLCGASGLGDLGALHKSRHVACSACTEVASIIAYALDRPSPELSNYKAVQDFIDGRATEVPYVQSQQYAEDVLSAVCNSTLVARLTRTENWLGLPYFSRDEIPVYTNDHPVDRDLISACRKLTHRLLRPKRKDPRLLDVVKAHGAQRTSAFICTQILHDCRWKESWSGPLFAGLEHVLHNDPGIITRLGPIAAIGGTILYLVAIFVFDSVTRGSEEKDFTLKRKEQTRTKRKSK